MQKSTERLLNIYELHKAAGLKEPLGCFFCNRYIQHYTDSLRKIFHEIDDKQAAILIDQWLFENNHVQFLPTLIKRD